MPFYSKTDGKKLRDAASQGDLKTIKRLCEVDGCNVNTAANAYGDTPLHKACRRGHLSLVEYLVQDRKANTTAVDEEGDTPLHSACIMGHVDVVRFLVQRQPNLLQCRNKQDWTPLHTACCWGRLAVVEYLVGEHDTSMWQVQTKRGQNALDMAKMRRSEAVVQFLENVKQQTMPLVLPAADLAETSTKSQPNNQVEEQTATTDSWDADVQALQQTMYRGGAPTRLSLSYIDYLRRDAVLVGKGAFGSVYRARDDTRHWDFALKQIMYPIHSMEQAQFIQQSFNTELAALSMACHPNIIRLFGYYVDDTHATQHVLLFEYADRGSLEAIFASDKTRQKLTGTVRLHILYQVMRALHYLHQGGPSDGNSTPFFHRDVKSANVCLTQNNVAKLIDCGLGKLVDDDNHSLKSAMSSGSLVFGTNGYTCPWYSKGGSRRYESACDVYSFGIVVMECITGCLQNGQSTRGSDDEKMTIGDFRSRYIEDDDEEEIENGLALLLEDADPDADWEQEILGQLCELALSCACQKKNSRPSTQSCIDVLSRLIHQEEFGLEKGSRVVSTAIPLAKTPCMLCRRNPLTISCQKHHGICGSCLDIAVQRNLHAPSIVCPVDGCFCQPYTMDQLGYAVSLDLFKAYQQYRTGMLNLFSILPDAVDRQSAFQSDVRAFMAHQTEVQDQLLEKNTELQTTILETLRESGRIEAEQLALLSDSINQNAQDQAEFHMLLLQEIRSANRPDPSATNQMLRRVLKGLTHYIASTQELCPRYVLVEIPDDKLGRPRRAKDWFRGIFKTKVNVYLVCQHSHQRMMEPIELEINRQWMVQIAPALNYTLLALKLACEMGASDTIASFLPKKVLNEQYSFYREILSKSWDKSALDAFDIMSNRNVGSASTAGRAAATKLTEEAYRVLTEKLTKEKRSWWREKMVAVMDTDGHVIYVLNKYAHLYKDFHHGVESVKPEPHEPPSQAADSGRTAVTEVYPGSSDDENWC